MQKLEIYTFSNIFSQILNFKARNVWILVILSKSCIFLNSYLKNCQNLGGFGSKSGKIGKNLKILNFLKKIKFRVKICKICSKSGIFEIKIEKNTRFWQNYQFPDIPSLKVKILTKKVWKSINFEFLKKQFILKIKKKNI